MPTEPSIPQKMMSTVLGPVAGEHLNGPATILVFQPVVRRELVKDRAKRLRIKGAGQLSVEEPGGELRLIKSAGGEQAFNGGDPLREVRPSDQRIAAAKSLRKRSTSVADAETGT